MSATPNFPNTSDTASGLPGHLGSQRQRRHLNTLLALAANPTLAGRDLLAMFRVMTETAAATLEVERVGIWRFDPTRTAIRCADLFERSSGQHKSDAEIAVTSCPEYFAALLHSDVIAAHDAREDQRTREFRQDYLEPRGVTSMLDATIRVDGTVVGVLCHEHVGEP